MRLPAAIYRHPSTLLAPGGSPWAMAIGWSAWAGSRAPSQRRRQLGTFCLRLEHSPAAPVQASRARGRAFGPDQPQLQPNLLRILGAT